MKNLIYVLLALLVVCIDLRAQTPKVAFVGITRGDSPNRGFSFVLGEDLTGGTVIYFTEEEYRNGCDDFSPDATCALTPGEPYLTYTVPTGGLLEGTVVSITEANGSETFNVRPTGSGTAVKGGSGNFFISSSDAFYAFDSNNTSDPQGSVTQVYAAITFNGPWDGALNTGEDPTPDHPTAVVFIAGGDDREYDPSLRNSAMVNKNDLTNAANWVNATAGSPSTVPFTGSVILPVEMIDFSAVQIDNSIKLTWSTTSEIDNSEFIIERSTDGRVFTTLGRVAGQGTTSSMSTYGYRDVKPAPGINYYRLKQVDYDGTFAYGEIATVRFSEGETMSVLISPNPFTARLLLDGLPESLDDAARPDLEVIIQDVHGRFVRREEGVMGPSLELSLSDLPPGPYFLRVRRAGRTLVMKRLVKI